MTVKINNKLTDLPGDIDSVAQLVKYLKLNEQGTAVAISHQLVTKDKWESTTISPNDNIVIISAAFGG